MSYTVQWVRDELGSVSAVLYYADTAAQVPDSVVELISSFKATLYEAVGMFVHDCAALRRPESCGAKLRYYTKYDCWCLELRDDCIRDVKACPYCGERLPRKDATSASASAEEEA